MISTNVFVHILIVFSVAQADQHVRAGTNTSICGFICDQPSGILLLGCRHGPSLFLVECVNSIPEVIRKDNERFNLNRSSGCFLFTNVQRNDSCVYEIWFYGSRIKILNSTRIIILDPVKILEITGNFSQKDSDISLHVRYSGAEATVVWELDGIACSSRCYLVENNKTLIVRGIRGKHSKRKFVVRVKNPISEDAREYHPEIQGETLSRQHLGWIMGPLILIAFSLFICYQQRTTFFKKLQPEIQATELLVNGDVADV